LLGEGIRSGMNVPLKGRTDYFLPDPTDTPSPAA
jgi:hypothetical protein